MQVEGEKVAHQNTLSKYDLLRARLQDLLSECELASSNRELLCSELARVAQENRSLKEHVDMVHVEGDITLIFQFFMVFHTFSVISHY